MRIFLSHTHEDRGTVEYLLRVEKILNGQAMPVFNSRCATCGQTVNHLHAQTVAPDVHAPATINHESSLASILDGHVNAVSKAFGVDVDSIIKLHQGVGAWRSIFYTVFSSGVKLFLVYEFTQMVLQLSKDWSPMVQFLFRLLLTAVSLAVIVNLCSRVGAILQLVWLSLGTRVWTYPPSVRSDIRKHLPILGERYRPRPTVLWPQTAL